MTIPSISTHEISHKRVLLRADFNVSLKGDKITDDTRITQVIPTITLLLKHHNRLIIMAHLGRPDGKRNDNYTLQPVAKRLQHYFPSVTVRLIDDFESEKGKEQLAKQTEHEICLLENIRYYEGEQKNDPAFAKELAFLGDVYVNDGFGVSHRADASVVGVAKLLPHYAGLLMNREITAISKIFHHPKHPVVAIIGGAKTETKIPLLYKLTELADYLLLGGAIANTFLATQGYDMGRSLVDHGLEKEVDRIIHHAKMHQTAIVLPQDTRCGVTVDDTTFAHYPINHIPHNNMSIDIGPETEALYGSIISKAKTIVWNGPVGYIENPIFAQGTNFLYYAVTDNKGAFSIVGGGDTLAALSNEDHVGKISHISTGGGAMLEFIEKGTLPGIEALK